MNQTQKHQDILLRFWLIAGSLCTFSLATTTITIHPFKVQMHEATEFVFPNKELAKLKKKPQFFMK